MKIVIGVIDYSNALSGELSASEKQAIKQQIEKEIAAQRAEGKKGITFHLPYLYALELEKSGELVSTSTGPVPNKKY